MTTDFGMRLQKLIDRKNISQKDLSEKSGVTESSISRYLNKNIKPHLDTASSLAQVLGVSVDYLMGNSPLPDITAADHKENQKTIEELLKDKGLEDKEIKAVQSLIDNLLDEE